MHNRFALLFISLFLSALAAHSQVAISPYSYYGLGEPFSAANSRNFAMGQVGIGSYDYSTINRLNPASYADMRLTTFDFNGFVTYSSQRSNHGEQALSSSGFQNVGMGFSNRKGFGIVLGLSPYSSVGYDVRVRDSILADTTYEAFTAQYAGSGGLNQLYVGTGVRLAKKFFVGANLNFAFGTSQREYRTDWDNSAIGNGYAEDRASLRGITPNTGLQYGDTLKIKVNVDRTKEIDQLLKDLDDQVAAIDKEKQSLEDEAEKGKAWEAEEQAKADALEAERNTLDGQLKTLMVDERANAKQIGQLQDKMYRLEKKRKDIQREIRARTKANTDARAKLELRRDKIAARKRSLEQEKQEIADGKRPATSEKVHRVMLRVGGTYDPGVSLYGRRLVRYSNSGTFDTLSTDTSTVTLPTKLGFGFSLGQPNKWNVAADITLQDWASFRYFQDSSTLGQSLGLHLGGEWIPEISSSKYARKMAYRLGAYYQKSPLQIGGQDIKEIGVTLGLGLPLGYYNPFGQSYSRINLGVSLSRRGTMEANLLQEMTVQLRVGVNLNDIWFIKRRID